MTAGSTSRTTRLGIVVAAATLQMTAGLLYLKAVLALGRIFFVFFFVIVISIPKLFMALGIIVFFFFATVMAQFILVLIPTIFIMWYGAMLIVTIDILSERIVVIIIELCMHGKYKC